MKFGVVVFPGSNCDQDCYHALDQMPGVDVDYIWHRKRDVAGYDCIVLPGGFSYGDYLRPGAISRFSPVMEAITDYALQDGLVLGICNGFQILLEAGLLSGAMIRNKGLRFVCGYTHLRVENADTPFTGECRAGEVLSMPVAHADGNYYLDQRGLAELEERNQIVLRYVSPAGTATADSNPNGACANIAAIANRRGNVVGMMPHPERCIEELLGTGSKDGRKIFDSIISYLEGRGRT